ncbi:MAG: DUF1738 domain-containing protein [Phycisphaerales bacterium]|nr:DUF1738 domain-containing protein [Phycisphaerales bacterium]
MTILAESPPCKNSTGDEKTGGGADRARALRERITDHVDALAKAVDDVRASESFRVFLDVQARFHRYSWGNTILIATQRPDATRVAGYKAWEKLGRHVRKGEHGIMIFAPHKFTRERERDNGESETVDGIGFHVTHVFDVGQTDGEALPTVDVPTVDALADDLLAKLIGVAGRRSIKVEFGAFREGFFGASKRGSVEIANTYATGQQAKTLAHELAHETLHWNAEGSFTRSAAELEAEAVAYVVCRHFGLDVELRASRYIALWGGDSAALRESLERIATTARGIIDDADSDASAERAPQGQGVAA